MEIVVISVFLGLIPAAIASSKGRSFGLWWFYGAALFIVAIFHAILLKTTEKQLLSDGMKKCPFCAEVIKPEAIVCRYCGKDIEPTKTKYTENSIENNNCSNCKHYSDSFCFINKTHVNSNEVCDEFALKLN